jgi:hypothetical protein
LQFWPASLYEGHAYEDPRKYWFSIYMKCWADLMACMYAVWMLLSTTRSFATTRFCNTKLTSIKVCYLWLILKGRRKIKCSTCGKPDPDTHQ